MPEFLRPGHFQLRESWGVADDCSLSIPPQLIPELVAEILRDNPHVGRVWFELIPDQPGKLRLMTQHVIDCNL